MGPLKYIVAIVGPQDQSIFAFTKYLQDNFPVHPQMNSKHDISLIILGVNLLNIEQCDSYTRLCSRFAEGFFLNMDFSESEDQQSLRATAILDD